MATAAGQARLVSGRPEQGELAAAPAVNAPLGQYAQPIGPEPLHSSPSVFSKETSKNWFMRLVLFIRSILLWMRSMVLGLPPKRVLDNEPSLHLFGLHRWGYFWFYVALRLYKLKWFDWMPVPRPTPGERSRRSGVPISRAVFYELKSISSISLKGGVGKTSVLKALVARAKDRRRDLNILIQDNNPDRGTLASRGRRTTNFSVKDLLLNLAHVCKAPDFKRYCNMMEEGYFLLASTRPNDYSTQTKMSSEDFLAVREKSETGFDLSAYDCGTDSSNESNKTALEQSDVILLLSTAAKDSIEQAITTYVWMCQEKMLRTKHVILVINRRHWWTNLDKIEQFVLAETSNALSGGDIAPRDPGTFRTLGVSWDLRLQLGLGFTSRQLRRSVRSDVDELIAECFKLMADGFTDDFDSQRTHAEAHVLSAPLNGVTEIGN